MTNNIMMIQKQIKAFNKFLSRAEKAGLIDNSVGAVIDELIDVNRMTKSGYGKAGSKYLESLSAEELAAYSADIEQARMNIKFARFTDTLLEDTGISELEDKKSALWKLHDELERQGQPMDSDQTKALIDNLEQIDYQGAIRNMARRLYDKNYGLADFSEWFNSQMGLIE